MLCLFASSRNLMDDGRTSMLKPNLPLMYIACMNVTEFECVSFFVRAQTRNQKKNEILRTTGILVPYQVPLPYKVPYQPPMSSKSEKKRRGRERRGRCCDTRVGTYQVLYSQ